TRAWRRQQRRGLPSFDELAAFDDEDPVEVLRFGDVVRDLEHRRAPCAFAHATGEHAPRRAVEPTKRLIEQKEPSPPAEEGARHPYPLTLAAADARAAFPELRREALRHSLEESLQVGLVEHRIDRVPCAARVAEVEVLDERPVPELDGGVDPYRVAPEATDV